MNIEYIIVQAGGKGTRLFPLTKNKPKALVTVNNRPIIFHLFEQFPKAKFIIIGDYKYDVLKNYLENFASVRFVSIHANGEGNACGIRQALSYIPENKSFMLLWSDLLLDSNIDFSALSENDYIGLTSKFSCSWEYKDNQLNKNKTEHNGVAGFFLFKNKSILDLLPETGSFTQWLQANNVNFEKLELQDTKETGTIEALKAVDKSLLNRCRPYNKMTFEGDKVTKEGLTNEGKDLIKREVAWYKEVSANNFSAIPTIYSFEPLVMKKIEGENIFKAPLSDSEKKTTIEKLVEKLNELHSMGKTEQNVFDMQEDYYSKTLKRLYSIRSCIQFANNEFININGKSCKNVLYNPSVLENLVNKLFSEKTEFGIIHGDGTLTNTMIDKDGDIFFIDARGYFGKTPLVGDVYYDWAKLYYSVEGAFDQFNIKNFELNITASDVTYKIANSGWEFLTDYMFSLIPNCNQFRVKLIHSIIWLSLASHCWEDYDSMCLAFYNGLYLLNELL